MRTVALGWLLLGLIAASEPPTGDESATRPAAESEVPLRQTIDRLIEGRAVGPLAPICDDADFVRRAHLDLTGVIPDAGRTQDFLDDPSPDKRDRLVGELLQDPAFDRYLATHLDALLLERRADTHVDVDAWETYLIDAVARRKPMDQLFRELLTPAEPESIESAASKFLLNREAEPHAMTRDVGRLFFGMDLQCAQCHDHPLVDDYLQEDYYGLHAFVYRTGLFVDPKTKKGSLSERADGEVRFESVFTGEGRQRMPPRLPLGVTVLDEPAHAEEEAYLVAPEKTQAGHPRYSRRARLGELLSQSESFRRNLANRVWVLVFGRGLVHPADFHSLDNPPSDPELLGLLADDWATHGFDLRYLVGELTLTRTYQRSCDPPPPTSVNFADIEARRSALAATRDVLSDRIAAARAEAEQARSAWREAMGRYEEATEALPQVRLRLDEALAAAEAAAAAADEAQAGLATLGNRVGAFERLLRATGEAAQAWPDEPTIREVLATLDARSAAIGDELAAAERAADEMSAARGRTRQAAEALREEHETLAASRGSPDELRRLERTSLAARQSWADARAVGRRLDADLRLCDDLLGYRDALAEDPQRAERLWASVVQRWTVNGQVAPLKPLSPEQLAASMMRATGVLDRHQTAAAAAVDQEPPARLGDESLPQEERDLARHVARQQAWLAQVRGSVRPFVSQFGGLPGEEFQATVNQALFVGNGPAVAGWLAASPGSLVGQLVSEPSSAALAERLALATLSRRPTLEEVRRIERHLSPGGPGHDASVTEDGDVTDDGAINEDGDVTKDGDAKEDDDIDRPGVIAEIVWAILSSAEFRFNH